MDISISADDVGMVEAAKDIGQIASKVADLVSSASSGGGEDKSAAAINAAETMFQSNIQCLSHILTMRKESEEIESDHHQMVAELREDFGRDLMAKEKELEEKDAKIAELEKSMDGLRVEMKELRTGQSLQGVWASLLSPDSFPLPEVVKGEDGQRHLSMDNSINVTTMGPGAKKVKSHIASALRMVSAQIAKEVISQAAVNEDGERIKNRQDGFMQKILEAVWFIEGRVDGELTSKAEHISKLEGEVEEAHMERDAARSAADQREAKLMRSLEHKDMVAEDMRAQLDRALSRPVNEAGDIESKEGLTTTDGVTPFKCASPSAFCSPYSEADETEYTSSNMEARVHFSAPISEIKRDSDVSKVGSVSRSRHTSRGKENTPPKAVNRSPSSMSSFKSPSYDHPYHPRLYTRGRNGRVSVVSPSPSKGASPATEGGMARSGVPSSTRSLRNSPSSMHSHTLRLNGSINPHATHRPTAKVHVSPSVNGDPYRRENDHAVNRPNRAFIVTSKSSIDSNRADIFLDSTSSKNIRDQEEASKAGVSPEQYKREQERSHSVNIVMRYGSDMKSLEAPTTYVYSSSATPPKPPTESGPFKSHFLNTRKTAGKA